MLLTLGRNKEAFPRHRVANYRDRDLRKGLRLVGVVGKWWGMGLEGPCMGCGCPVGCGELLEVLNVKEWYSLERT